MLYASESENSVVIATGAATLICDLPQEALRYDAVSSVFSAIPVWKLNANLSGSDKVVSLAVVVITASAPAYAAAVVASDVRFAQSKGAIAPHTAAALGVYAVAVVKLKMVHQKLG